MGVLLSIVSPGTRPIVMRRGEGWDVVKGAWEVLREDSSGKVMGIGMSDEMVGRSVDVRSIALRWGNMRGGRVPRVVRGFDRRFSVERERRCVSGERG